MNRRGDPCDIPQAEAVHLSEHETGEDVAADPPRFIDDVDDGRRLPSASGRLSAIQFENRDAPIQAETTA